MADFQTPLAPTRRSLSGDAQLHGNAAWTLHVCGYILSGMAQRIRDRLGAVGPLK